MQAALGRDRLGEYQAQAAIAALHADATRVEDTDWVQIVEWYDELLRFADTPIVRLNRAVAVGEADGAPAGLAALAEVDEDIPRRDAVAAYLHEKNGDLELAARLYADAARNAPNLAERDHQMRQAARLNQLLRRTGDRRRRRRCAGRYVPGVLATEYADTVPWWSSPEGPWRRGWCSSHSWRRRPCRRCPIRGPRPPSSGRSRRRWPTSSSTGAR